MCGVDGVGRQSAGLFCYACRRGHRAVWALLRRKRLRTQTGRLAFQTTVRHKAKNSPGTDIPVRLVAPGAVSWSEPGASSCGAAGPDADMQEQGDGGRAINQRP